MWVIYYGVQNSFVSKFCPIETHKVNDETQWKTAPTREEGDGTRDTIANFFPDNLLFMIIVQTSRIYTREREHSI